MYMATYVTLISREPISLVRQLESSPVSLSLWEL